MILPAYIMAFVAATPGKEGEISCVLTCFVRLASASHPGLLTSFAAMSPNSTRL
jgi:hypothetical protein